MQKSINLMGMSSLAAVLFVANIVFADLTTPTAYWKLDSNGNDSAGSYSMSYVPAGMSYDTTDHVSNSTASGIFDTGNAVGVRPAPVSGYDPLGATYSLGISFWFKWTSAPSGSTDLRKLVQKWGGTVTTATNYFQVYTYGDELGFALGNVYNNAAFMYTDGANIQADTWYHVGINVNTQGTTSTDEVVKIYLTEAGQSSVSLALSSTWAPADDTGGTSQIIQCRNYGWLNVGDAAADSLVDEVRLYRNTSFSDTDIQTIYTLENIVPEPATMGLCVLGSLMLLRRKK